MTDPVWQMLTLEGTAALYAATMAMAEASEQAFGLFTHDVRRIVTAWRELEVGGLVVNGSSNFRLDHVPFGGVKDSGFGRESPRPMIEDYTVVKTLLLRDLSIWGTES